MKLFSFLAVLSFMLATPAAWAAAQLTPSQAATVAEKALSGTGAQIQGDMKAPQGFHGFIVNYNGQQLPLYVLPDGNHAVIGTLFDAKGNNLTSPQMQKATTSGITEEQWADLASASYVVEGNPKAKRIVYTFMDTRCPYCHDMWKMTKQWLTRDGDVQVRNILVAVITKASLPEAASVLESKNPLKAWEKLEGNFGHNPDPDPDAGTAVTRLRIQTNNMLMTNMGFYGTPAVVYKDAEGKIHSLSGMPRNPKILEEVFGPRS